MNTKIAIIGGLSLVAFIYRERIKSMVADFFVKKLDFNVIKLSNPAFANGNISFDVTCSLNNFTHLPIKISKMEIILEVLINGKWEELARRDPNDAFTTLEIGGGEQQQNIRVSSPVKSSMQNIGMSIFNRFWKNEKQEYRVTVNAVAFGKESFPINTTNTFKI